jgi:hypothetical protein
VCFAAARPAVALYQFMPDSGEALVWDAPSALRSAVQWVLV